MLAAGAFGLLLAGAAAFIYWTQYGPGLDNEVARLAAVAEVRPGMTVADIGAGRGALAVRMAARLGPHGRLYATEMEGEKQEAIRQAAAARGLDNITVVQAGERSTGLPDACCEVVYLRRVYHHLGDRAAMGKALHAALRPGGRLVIIDLVTPSWLFFLDHGVAPEEAAAQLTAAGFQLERRIDDWSFIDYCLVFRK